MKTMPPLPLSVGYCHSQSAEVADPVDEIGTGVPDLRIQGIAEKKETPLQDPEDDPGREDQAEYRPSATRGQEHAASQSRENAQPFSDKGRRRRQPQSR
jgi:hypothetical protein